MTAPSFHFAQTVPPAEIHARIARLQTALAQAQLPLAVVTHRTDLYYLTGTMQDAFLLARADAEPILPVRKAFSRARAESPLADVRPSRGFKTLVETLRELCGDQPLTVGIDLDVLPAATYLKLAEALPAVTWRDSSMILRTLRAVKSPWEIARIEEAAAMVGLAYQAALENLRPGITELELTTLVEATFRRAGHSGIIRLRRPGLELVVAHIAAGVSAATPVAFDGPVGSEGLHPASGGGPGRRAVERGVPVMFDLLGNSRGYTADIARIFCVGEPPDELKRANDFCREALRRIETMLVPGTPWGAVYEEVDRWAKQTGEPTGFMGYAENRVKFFGHGVGLEVDELPILARGFAQPLEAGHVLAVEPKAFYPHLGPAGLENTYVIEAAGPRPLLNWPEEITVL
ncbi:MAG TPA: Xaa-Pro peptidase family protein [bacterium]|nr:Xaa-Pro peptidase family protein [bacterium]